VERSILNYQHSQLNSETAGQCNFRAVVGPDGTSYSVTSNNGFTLALKSWSFEMSDVDLALRRIFSSELALNWSYLRRDVLYFSPKTAVIPKRLFDESTPQDYFRLLHSEPTENAFGEVVTGTDLCLVCDAPTNISTLVDYYLLPDTGQKTQAAACLRQTLAHAPTDGAEVFVNVRREFVQVIVFERRNLLFFNTYPFKKPNDLLYFTLLGYEQCQLNPDKTQLTIAGELLNDSEIFRLYQRFIRHIRFLPATPMSGVPAELPTHFYFEHHSL
jgi:Protein of unknown function (DUF3822)